MIPRVQLIVLHASVVLVTVTGVVFAWMKYAMKSDDPFSVINHPLQPYMLAVHVVVAPLTVFALGWTFANHMWPLFSGAVARKRPTGVWAMFSVAPMILSGYLLQVSTAESLRKAMAVAHWITSGFFVIAFAIHVIWRRG